MGLRLSIGAIVAAACAAAGWALLAGPAVAQPGVQLMLVHGSLTATAPAVSAVPGHAVSVTVTVTDARGTGAGWTLKLSSSKAVAVTRVAASCAAGSTCTLPSSSGIGTAPVVLRALPATGMGVMKLTVTLAALRSGAAAPVKFAVSG